MLSKFLRWHRSSARCVGWDLGLGESGVMMSNVLLFMLSLALVNSFTQVSKTLNQGGGIIDTTTIYFDISLENEPIGKLTFRLIKDPIACPKLRENFVKLCTGERKPIDPQCTYVGCTFKHSPQSVEGFPQYRWAHEVEGRKRNALGRPTERILEGALRQCYHSIYGGVYYGMNYDHIKDPYGVVLTVPLVGPLRGSSSFSIIRVDESPMEWKERLLLNSAVLGSLESGIETLHIMARQSRAPPMITGSGTID